MAENRFVYLMLAPAVLFLGLLVAYPVCLLVYNSFYEVETITPNIRGGSGLKTTQKAVTSSRIGESAWRTVKYSLFALTFEFIFGFCAALLFAAIADKSRWHRTSSPCR